MPLRLLLLSIVFLAACQSAPKTVQESRAAPFMSTVLQNVQPLIAQGESGAAARYLDQTMGLTEDTNIIADLALRSAHLHLDAGNPAAASAAMQRVAEYPPLLARSQRLAQARIALQQGQAAAALGLLQGLPPFAEPGLQARALVARASAGESSGQPAIAFAARLEFDRLPSLSSTVRAQNQDAIWQLLATPLSVQFGAAPIDGAGWVALRQVYDSSRTQGQLNEALSTWRQRYAQHPASASGFADALLQDLPNLSFNTEKVALLLPQQGRLATVSGAIESGYRAAMAQNEGNIAQVQVYDSSDIAGPLGSIMQRAAQEGASAFVGPLTKTRVQELMQTERVFPAVTLNDPDNSNVSQEGLLRFGLRPEDEAIDAAAFAREQGWLRAVMLTPNSEQGQRSARAFESAFLSLGGQVLGAVEYDPKAVDFAPQVRELLQPRPNPNQSRDIRKRDLIARGDIDFLFLPASTKPARLILPQLKFFGASKLPVVATSRINSGSYDSRLDLDLDRVYFNDATILLEPQILPGSIASGLTDKGEPAALTRLRAMGADAYLIMQRADQLSLDPNARILGATGILRVNELGQVVRTLPWALMQNGQYQLFVGSQQRATQNIPLSSPLSPQLSPRAPSSPGLPTATSVFSAGLQPSL